ncbi:phytoene/squalene synthase family protein [Rhizobium sp. CC-YZS058]|uniref:phytoene/squalene synthase family protein n=1 Tax=Rhizobium sp. CC-YZS058 TaxID=3042153 RepID=UPI002B05B847|nr:phytoene/squalene synthase family protein [Rhizobium sp. CC-YZS058]MEA3534804.1 phytoene/squalene synthase family protein [Rhizobium sp. CC-YZS058]
MTDQTASASSSTPVLDPCLAALRDHDRDRYLACLLAPQEKRPALAALYAFNAEIARVRELVHEPLPGEIRLQWWRDVLEQGGGSGSEGHPVATALLDTIRTWHLPVGVLTDMIDARIFDLYDDPMESRTALEGYAGETASALIQLSCLILDPEGARASSDAAGHAGVAQTVAGLLMLAPIHRQRGQLYLPADLLTATGTSREMVLDGRDKAAIGRAVSAFVGLGREHLSKARATAQRISRANRPAYATVALADPVFRRAEAAGADLFDAPIAPAQWRRQWWMWRAARTGRW